MNRLLLPLLALGVLVGGCNESTSPRDVYPPAAPRGLYSVTGDHQATLRWLANTESDLGGYRIYQSPCASGPDCPYARIAVTTRDEFVVTGLTNGETRFFAVAAVDRAGNESDLSYEDVFDTPRPEGFARALGSYLSAPATAGYDFSGYAVRPWDAAETDLFYGFYVDTGGGVHQQVFVPDFGTDIQDAGYATTLDAVDFAPGPGEGWSPSGTVEAIVGHCYVVWTRDNHFAKFRVTSVGPGRLVFDWAYQVDPGNRELRAKPAREEGASRRRPIVWLPS